VGAAFFARVCKECGFFLNLSSYSAPAHLALVPYFYEFKKNFSHAILRCIFEMAQFAARRNFKMGKTTRAQGGDLCVYESNAQHAIPTYCLTLPSGFNLTPDT
jgi:hypothetical protein